MQHGLIQDTFQQSSVDPVSFKNQIQACQANSPQIKTDSQVKRNERSLKKRLFFAIDALEKEKGKVHYVQAKKKWQ